MGRVKRQPTLAGRVIAAWMVVLVLSNVVIGLISYRMFMRQQLESRAKDAENVAIAMATRIDGDKFSEIMATLEKNDYWYEVKDYADQVSIVFNTAYIYILDKHYDENVLYFAEGAPGDAPFDLGMGEPVEIYADEMFETLRTGIASTTEPYASGDYGDMVSGFAPIFNKNGDVVGVVGVDFFFTDIVSSVNSFGLTIVLIIVGFSLFCGVVMSHMGVKMAGKPLDAIDRAAQQLATGDMDIHLNIRSTSEIGRLAKSFTSMIEAMNVQIQALEALARGDLTVRIEPRSSKDVMGQAIVQIIENLNSMFAEISRSATQVSTGARQVSDSSQELAHGATEQSAAVEELLSSISDVNEQANGNLTATIKTKTLADEINSEAQIGSGHMERMTQAVHEIMEASVAINNVIKVIDDIAFQTNILALNAAVEAARAGQHGKGFAVVAEEVRNLASKSAGAAKDTNDLITNSIEKAKLGASIAGETSASLSKIIKGVDECAHLVNGIASAFETQLSALKQIDDSVEQVSKVVYQNNAAAEESAAVSQQMSAQSTLLHELIERFKIRDDVFYLDK